MKCDITDLLTFFDELMPSTDEEQKVYWFKSSKKDGTIIIFVVSLFEESIGVIIKSENGVCFSHIDLEKCSEINVLDQEKKCLEVLNPNGRCFLSLLDGAVFTYTENK
ncbi:MAG: hypothetical protein CL833_05975 [Crocinitomicaceae bacterium]|nr:hypothetical protein [Crocinitomicaceae bacterium]|tara:strand:- start:287 stop:610 length:324 start_codon:yes stop_codon:yes gene_type:complete